MVRVTRRKRGHNYLAHLCLCAWQMSVDKTSAEKEEGSKNHHYTHTQVYLKCTSDFSATTPLSTCFLRCSSPALTTCLSDEENIRVVSCMQSTAVCWRRGILFHHHPVYSLLFVFLGGLKSFSTRNRSSVVPRNLSKAVQCRNKAERERERERKNTQWWWVLLW